MFGGGWKNSWQCLPCDGLDRQATHVLTCCSRGSRAGVCGPVSLPDQVKRAAEEAGALHFVFNPNTRTHAMDDAWVLFVSFHIRSTQIVASQYSIMQRDLWWH